jgi:hypothetical protein
MTFGHAPLDPQAAKGCPSGFAPVRKAALTRGQADALAAFSAMGADPFFNP